MENDILKHLYDMREAALAISRFVHGTTFDDYEQDELLRSGVERKFEIIGEALNRIGRIEPTHSIRYGSIATSCHSGTFLHMVTTVLTTG
jgi:uncharacterized protein with HEPN domain